MGLKAHVPFVLLVGLSMAARLVAAVDEMGKSRGAGAGQSVFPAFLPLVVEIFSRLVDNSSLAGRRRCNWNVGNLGMIRLGFVVSLVPKCEGPGASSLSE